jgi:hypothetical protein
MKDDASHEERRFGLAGGELMAAPRPGHGTDSRWPLTTFSAEVVVRIAESACPNLEFIADPDEQAEAMNDAGRELLFSLRRSAKASASEAWGNDIAEACKNFIDAFGKPAIRSAARLGILDKFDRIKNPRSKLRGIGGRKEADQKNAASCGEYVPREI